MSPSQTVADQLATLARDIVGVPIPVRIRAWDGSAAGPADGPTLVVRRPQALRHLMWRPGELGLSRAYVNGDLDVEGDLAEALRRARKGWTVGQQEGTARRPLNAAATALGLGVLGRPPTTPASEARMTGRRHTRRRDRAAIAHHYDLSNAFYAVLLDDTMSYSCAYYTREGQTLADAQRAKLDLVCRQLELRPGMRLLDVGCGWGALILHAAERYGVQATGITLSQQQHDFVSERIVARGLSDAVSVRVQDYRELNAETTFDAVASIAMGEHVGEGHYPSYVRALRTQLRPAGRLLLQQMSRHQDADPSGGPFITRYIAPDMHMRPLSQTVALLERGGFEVRNVHAMREHYVRTALAWIERLRRRRDDVVRLIGAEQARIWELYLVGGAASFAEGRMGVDQILATPTASAA